MILSQTSFTNALNGPRAGSNFGNTRISTFIRPIARCRVRGRIMMHMPGCTGIQAVPLLRGLDAALPCILYSGRWSLDLEQEVLALGAFACLKKPVEPAALRRTVRAALGWPAESAHHNN